MIKNAGLIAHWKLAGDPSDAECGNHGEATNVSYTEGPAGVANGAAVFNGVDSVVEVRDAEALRLGNSDFSIAVWVKPENPMRGVFGDVLSKFDPAVRCGINLNVAGSSPGYCGMSDTRHVHFGIDDGYAGGWTDCGRPWPSNSLVPCLIAFDGQLYCGISDANDPKDAAHVFRWAGGTDWVDCGRLGNDPNHLSVQSMVVHDCKLYAGTGVWDWERAFGKTAGFRVAPTRVFVYAGGTDWQDLGQVGAGSRVLCLGSFDGELYAGIDSVGAGKCFKYDGSTWLDCGAPDGQNLNSLLPLGGTLYASTHGNIYKYEGGRDWTCIGHRPFGITQIHTMQAAGGQIWIGTWPQGYVLRYEGDENWVIAGRLGLPEGLRQCNEINDLTVYNGKLYAGVIPKAQVYRYESDGHWTLLGRLASRPDWTGSRLPTWGRVTSLTSFQGRLFASTGACQARAIDVDPELTCGRICAMQAGQVVSHEADIGYGWTHLAAIREGKELRLYVNGRIAGSSLAPSSHTFDLANTQALRIGAGQQTAFSGAIADLRLYGTVLDEDRIMELTARRSG